MKTSAPTVALVAVWIGVLIAAYVVGLGIKKIRPSGVKVQSKVIAKSEKPAEKFARDKVTVKPNTTSGNQAVWEDNPYPEEESILSGERVQGIGTQFTNDSKESNIYEVERTVTTLERSGGGWPRAPQLSEEEITNFRKEMQELSDRAEQMTEEERRNVHAEIVERYGFTTR